MSTSHYLWDFENDSYLFEMSDGGEVTTYTNEPTYYGRLISQCREVESTYYHFDGQRNTRQLSNATEVVTDAYEYFSFGDEVLVNGTNNNPFRFCGEYDVFSDETEHRLYVRLRSYQPSAGRWMSIDPIGNGDGTGAYVFCRNNSQNRIDPDGAAAFWNEYSRGNDDLAEPNYQTAIIRIELTVSTTACESIGSALPGPLGPYLGGACCGGMASARLCYTATAVSSPRASLFLDPMLSHGGLFISHKGSVVKCGFTPSAGTTAAGSSYSCCVSLGDSFFCSGDTGSGSVEVFSKGRWLSTSALGLPYWNWGHVYQTIDFGFTIRECGIVGNPRLQLNQPPRHGFRATDLLRLINSNVIYGPYVAPHPPK